MCCAVWPTLEGSSGSGGSDGPCATAQKRQFRVQAGPIIRKVAVRWEKHSQRFGHLASWQTVCRRLFFSRPLTFSYVGPFGRLRFNQCGFWLCIFDFLSATDPHKQTQTFFSANTFSPAKSAGEKSVYVCVGLWPIYLVFQNCLKF